MRNTVYVYYYGTVYYYVSLPGPSMSITPRQDCIYRINV